MCNSNVVRSKYAYYGFGGAAIKKFGSSSVALLRGAANSCQSKFDKSCWLDLRFRGDHEMVYHPQDILGKKV